MPSTGVNGVMEQDCRPHVVFVPAAPSRRLFYVSQASGILNGLNPRKSLLTSWYTVPPTRSLTANRWDGPCRCPYKQSLTPYCSSVV